jgi:hypothetical protein
MKPIKSLSTSIIVIVSLATSAIDGAAWAAAATQHHKVVSKHLYMNAPDPNNQSKSGAARDPAKSGEARDAAIRECSGSASKWSNRDWQTTQAATYAGCMTSKGQTP